MNLKQKLLAKLLHLANSNPPEFIRQDFYELKSKLLKKYAKLATYEYQEIVKECWGPASVGCCLGDRCDKCGGTGMFDRYWWLLKRYEWCGHVFHTPDLKTRIEPEVVRIKGRVQHQDYGQKSREALMWLFLLTGETWLFREYFFCYLADRKASWLPLSMLQFLYHKAEQRFPKFRNLFVKEFDPPF